MHRKFIAAVLATSMTIAGFSAAPAKADADDIAKILAGVVAVGIIGAAIADKKNNKKQEVQRVDNNGYYYSDSDGLTPHRYYQEPKHHHKHKHHHKKWHHKHKHPRHSNKPNYHNPQYHQPDFNGRNNILPAYCRMTAQTHKGPRSGYSGRCLRNNFGLFNTLPRKCAMPTIGKRGLLFRDRCLARHGYLISRR